MDISNYFGVNFEFLDKEDLIMKIKALLVARQLKSGERDTLRVAWMKGQMDSGDTPSKGGRGELLGKGILCQTASMDNGYTFSVTYPFGYTVVKALEVSEV